MTDFKSDYTQFHFTNTFSHARYFFPMDVFEHGLTGRGSP